MRFTFRYADVISVGDELLVRENSGMVPDKVIDVSTAVMNGIKSYFSFIKSQLPCLLRVKNNPEKGLNFETEEGSAGHIAWDS